MQTFNLFKKYFVISLLSLGSLSLGACNNKNNQNQPPTTGQQNISNTASCPTTGLVGAKGTEVNPAETAKLYQQYFGSTPNFYFNAVSGSGDHQIANMGDFVVFAKNYLPIGKPVDLRSGQVLALKLIEKNGGFQAIVGTLSNLQVCSADPSIGLKADSCKVFNRAGGIDSIDVLGNQIFYTTIGGDFGYIGLDTMESQSGCGRLLYQAADHTSDSTKTPLRAFRVAAGKDSAYFLTRNNSGDTSFNLNSVIANLTDWIDNKTFRFLSRETHLYSYAPGATEPTEVTLDDTEHRYLMDDLVGGQDGKVFAGFWAPRAADADALKQCLLQTPIPAICPGFTLATPLHVLLAYIINTTQGIVSVDGKDAKRHEVTPVININAEKGCSPDSLASPSPSCLRFPNLGLFFVNRLSALADSVFMRGLTGYARLQGESLEVTTFLPSAAGSPGIGLPVDATSDAKNTFAAGAFVHLAPFAAGLIEMADISGSSPMTVHATQTILPDSESLHRNTLYAGGRTSVYTEADDSFQRLSLTDPTDKTVFDKIIIAGNDYTPDGIFPVAVEINSNNGDKDRVAVFSQYSGDFFTLGFYEANQAAPVFNTGSLVLSPNFSTIGISPIAFIDDLVFVLLNGAAASQHTVFVFKVDWTAHTATAVTVNTGSSTALEMLGVDKTQTGYQVYAWTSAGISILSFNYDSSSNIWTPVAPAPAIPMPATARGVAAGGERIFFVMDNGSVEVHKTDGSLEKTVDGAVALENGQKVILSITPRYVNEKLVIPAIISATVPPSARAVTSIVDLKDDTNKHTYPLPYILANNYGDKFFGASFFNAIEAFDLSKPTTDTFKGGSIDLGGSKNTSPGGAVGEEKKGPGTGGDVAASSRMGGAGGCSLGETSAGGTYAVLLILLLALGVRRWVPARRRK